MNNIISFIIPAFNVEKYICTCIDNILNQKIDDWELIIVDDGSTDATAEICDMYAEKDKRIKVMRQKNAGSAVARNSGLDMATGKWIAFIDGDDWIEENYLETLQPYMEQNYDFIMYSYYEVRGMDKKSRCNALDEIELGKDEFQQMVMDVIDTEKRVSEVASSRSQFWTKIYQKEFLFRNKLRLDPQLRMSQDVMFNLCVYNNAVKAIFIPKLLYNYRILGDSTCHRYSTEQLSRILKLTEAMGSYVKEMELKQKGEILFQKRILVSLVNACRLDFCHKDNPNSYTVRRGKFLCLCKQEPFASALKLKVICSFSIRKQICMWFVKFRCFRLLNFFLG